ncbi:hypothetical protein RUM44_008797 [Polyplax serrata]|uniref:C3H1-type domain-containing protein n=1 Tax=Polyplax serrata TaxID=468196 RepID=A0ABR1BE63_POLSC
MAGLVADYGADTDSEDSDNSPVNDGPLPAPAFVTGCDDTIKDRSVFVNPFAEADKAEKAILEKHVKMISVDVKMVNGKKICWNYRKNKCRYGHNCKYAHDSDLQIDKSAIIPTQMNIKQVDAESSNVTNANEPIGRKKRPGMAHDIIPSKKIMKFYNKQKKWSQN